jgi:NAD(P)-dependent dehydrogenase (short-subunit alcohol dehydrogenase family)
MINEKIVFITGGSGRIGSSLARNIIASSGKVVLVDVNKKGLNDMEKEFGKKNCLAIFADIGNTDEVDLSIASAIKKFGKLDAAVHCAYPRSEAWGTKFEDLKQEFLMEDLTRQLGGAILFSQRILRFFKKQGYGNLIHTSSIHGISTPKFEHYSNTSMISPIEYSAIKSGLIAMTKYLAKYYKNNNIRVNCISPGGILDKQPEKFIQKYRDECNKKGLLDANDIVGSILFLLSDYSQYINGQNIIIDDGWSL